MYDVKNVEINPDVLRRAASGSGTPPELVEFVITVRAILTDSARIMGDSPGP